MLNLNPQKNMLGYAVQGTASVGNDAVIRHSRFYTHFTEKSIKNKNTD